jgi:hypothetical protein
LRDDPIVNLVAGETWQAEPCPSLRNEEVRRPDHERHEECSEGQRGHHEYRQHDIAIWKTPAQRPEEASSGRLQFWFRKHATPQY